MTMQRGRRGGHLSGGDGQPFILDILRRQRDQGTAVLIVVHDLSLAAAYADQVAVMKQGRLVAHGPTPEVMTADLLSHTYDHPVETWPHPETGQLLILPRRT